uniref:Protein kinase domain-containing protein n=1 Tax=Caenorhabditis tropicalis TaxID=1561998 RepID=A0A1I7TCL8_9PELO
MDQPIRLEQGIMNEQINHIVENPVVANQMLATGVQDLDDRCLTKIWTPPPPDSPRQQDQPKNNTIEELTEVEEGCLEDLASNIVRDVYQFRELYQRVIFNEKSLLQHRIFLGRFFEGIRNLLNRQKAELDIGDEDQREAASNCHDATKAKYLNVLRCIEEFQSYINPAEHACADSIHKYKHSVRLLLNAYRTSYGIDSEKHAAIFRAVASVLCREYICPVNFDHYDILAFNLISEFRNLLSSYNFSLPSNMINFIKKVLTSECFDSDMRMHFFYDILLADEIYRGAIKNTAKVEIEQCDSTAEKLVLILIYVLLETNPVSKEIWASLIETIDVFFSQMEISFTQTESCVIATAPYIYKFLFKMIQNGVKRYWETLSNVRANCLDIFDEYKIVFKQHRSYVIDVIRCTNVSYDVFDPMQDIDGQVIYYLKKLFKIVSNLMKDIENSSDFQQLYAKFLPVSNEVEEDEEEDNSAEPMENTSKEIARTEVRPAEVRHIDGEPEQANDRNQVEEIRTDLPVDRPEAQNVVLNAPVKEEMT